MLNYSQVVVAVVEMTYVFSKREQFILQVSILC